MGVTAGPLVVVLCCLGLSFLLSGFEAGVLALSRFRVRQQVRAGVHRARLLHEYLENPENCLWTILVGNTVALFVAFSFMVIALYGELGRRPWVFTAVFLLIVFLFYVFCDLLPKVLFRLFPNRLCLVCVMPFRLLHLALSPLVGILTWFSDVLLALTGQQRFKGHIFSTRREVRLALQESAQILTSEERAMINRVLDLQDLTVRSITVPLSKVVGVTAQTPVRELLEICRRQPLNRLVIWGEAPTRRIVGVVSVNSLLFSEPFDPDATAGRFATPPLQLREDVPLEEALRRMQRTRQRTAVVLGFDQRELGIVLLRDLLRSIFGEVTL